jgi:hypothetical protein
MQRKTSVGDVGGKSPGERFAKALDTAVSVAAERASDIRRYVPKARDGKAEKESARRA